MNIPFSIIVAVDKDFGIGKNGVLPWDLPGEIKHFKEVTTASYNEHENAVIMGRKTWESIPSKFRPLPKRINLVLTRQKEFAPVSGVLYASSLNDALRLIKEETKGLFGKVFVIGGAELFKNAIHDPLCREIYLTQIQSSFDCDRFFPSLPLDFKQTSRSAVFTENGINYVFLHFVK